jgi:putative flippase GtrA
MQGVIEPFTAAPLKQPSGTLSFLAVGLLSYGVNQALLLALYRLTPLSASLPAASALALELSILVRFLLNDSWTFRDRREWPFMSRLAQSNLGALGSALIALLTLNALSIAFGVNYLVASSVGIALGLVWNWLWSSRVVWRPGPAIL